ncbi:hypothetical protein [Trinickia sp. EG282A]|uniref:hypothetical protein n=1 Tax=Trinickia sp. EG282A TaxID=3237013 RepID=UPI0034D258C2
MPDIPIASFPRVDLTHIDTTGPIGPASHADAPTLRADSNTVSPSDTITLYAVKDRAHKNPIALIEGQGELKKGDFAKFEDKSGARYLYKVDGPNTFIDKKGRKNYVIGTPQHWEASQRVKTETDMKITDLRNAPLPKYVESARKYGGLIGAGLAGSSAAAAAGAGTVVATANPAVAGMAGFAAGTAAGIVGKRLGRTFAGAAATSIANGVIALDQSALRRKSETLVKQGVEVRAETWQDAVINGHRGTTQSIVGWGVNTIEDTGRIVADEMAAGLDELAEKGTAAAASVQRETGVPIGAAESGTSAG